MEGRGYFIEIMASPKVSYLGLYYLTSACLPLFSKKKKNPAEQYASLQNVSTRHSDSQISAPPGLVSLNEAIKGLNAAKFIWGIYKDGCETKR